jgi:hypothetical protein
MKTHTLVILSIVTLVLTTSAKGQTPAEVQLDKQLKIQASIAESKATIAKSEASIAESQIKAASAGKGESKGVDGTIKLEGENTGFPAKLVGYTALDDIACQISLAIKESCGVSLACKSVFIVNDMNLTADSMNYLMVKKQLNLYKNIIADVYAKNKTSIESYTGWKAAFEAQLKLTTMDRPATKIQTQGGSGSGEESLFGGITSGATSVQAALSLVADIAKFFKTDYTITGVKFDANPAVMNALLAKHLKADLNAKPLYPSEHMVDDSDILNKYFKLATGKKDGDPPADEKNYLDIVSQLAVMKADIVDMATWKNRAQKYIVEKKLDDTKTKPIEKILAEQVSLSIEMTARLYNTETAVTGFSEFAKGIFTKGKGESYPPIVRAALYESLKTEPVYLLNITIAESGGEAVISKNMIRNDKIAYLGGADVAYLLTDIEGNYKTSGNVFALNKLPFRYNTRKQHENPATIFDSSSVKKGTHDSNFMRRRHGPR